jgi:hypothetical protein
MEGSGFKPYKLIFLIALGAGAWYFFTHFRVQGWEGLKLQSRSGTPAAQAPGTPPPPPQNRTTLRVATINFGPLDEQKLAKPPFGGRIAQIVRLYDVVALQDIQAKDLGVLVKLVEAVNAPGRHYDFAAAPHVGRVPVERYLAFVFDAQTVQIDRRSVTLVDDRSRQFCNVPLVASFRARGPAENEAFTFTVINVQTPADRVAAELPLMAAAFRAARDGGRGEDDILLAGEIGADEGHLKDLGRLPNLATAAQGLPTTTQGGRAVDNILFDRQATMEFTYRSGVADLARELGCSPQEAADVSEHLPVWAEFTLVEGGQSGNVAAKP